MPATQRKAILLREWQGLSYREIADEMGLTQPAVETLIFRARRSLASALEQPVKHRRRLVRSVDAGALLASLKTLIVGNVAASVATAVAVAASATALTAATIQRGNDFPSHATPVPRVEQTKPATPRANLADRASTEAVFPPAASPSSNGHPKKWAGTHPRANGKDKPKHANNGHKSGHGAKPPQASNRSASSASHDRVNSASPGKSAPAPAYGKSGKKG